MFHSTPVIGLLSMPTIPFWSRKFYWVSQELRRKKLIWQWQKIQKFVSLHVIKFSICYYIRFQWEQVALKLWMTIIYQFNLFIDKNQDQLATIIHRGRDHGLPTYTQVRESCGLLPVTAFSELNNTVDDQTIAALQKTYQVQ